MKNLIVVGLALVPVQGFIFQSPFGAELARETSLRFPPSFLRAAQDDEDEGPKLFPVPKDYSGLNPTSSNDDKKVPRSIDDKKVPRSIDVSKPHKDNKVPIAFVGSPKIQLQYTCKLCSHTSRHTITRLAYTEGIVICQCKGCKAKHIIADNLGWYNFLPSGGTLEDYVAASGGKETFTRVGKDVWEMENSLHKEGAGPRFWTSEEVAKWLTESGFGTKKFSGKCGSELIDLATMGKIGDPLLEERIMALLHSSEERE